jgi:hypothetical protein
MRKILIRAGYDFDSKGTYLRSDPSYTGMDIEDKKRFITDLMEELENEHKFLSIFWSAPVDIS